LRDIYSWDWYFSWPDQ